MSASPSSFTTTPNRSRPQSATISIAQGNPSYQTGIHAVEESQTPDDSSPRILIVRLGPIGDAILTMPVACSLRDQYPDAFLAWAVQEEAAPIVRHHRALDEVIEIPKNWCSSPSGLRSVRKRLKPLQFTTAIDCQGTFPSALTAALSSAPRRIGFRGKHSRWLGRCLNNEKVSPVFHHTTDRSLELLTPLEINRPQVRWDLPIQSCDQEWADGYRSKIAAPRIAVMNPGGTWASKQWEPDRFASTARYIADRYQYHSVIAWGTFEDRLMAEEIVELSEGSATLAPDTSLNTLAALIETSDLFISGDTGPLHMAVAVGTQTIGLYGATRPGDCGPYGQVALQLQYESGSVRHRRSADNLAMRAIDVHHVCAVIDDMHASRDSESKAA